MRLAAVCRARRAASRRGRDERERHRARASVAFVAADGNEQRLPRLDRDRERRGVVRASASVVAAGGEQAWEFVRVERAGAEAIASHLRVEVRGAAGRGDKETARRGLEAVPHLRVQRGVVVLAARRRGAVGGTGVEGDRVAACDERRVGRAVVGRSARRARVHIQAAEARCGIDAHLIPRRVAARRIDAADGAAADGVAASGACMGRGASFAAAAGVERRGPHRDDDLIEGRPGRGVPAVADREPPQARSVVHDRTLFRVGPGLPRIGTMKGPRPAVHIGEEDVVAAELDRRVAGGILDPEREIRRPRAAGGRADEGDLEAGHEAVEFDLDHAALASGEHA